MPPLVAQRIKRQPAMRETPVRSLGWEDPVEKEMATHSNILAWRILWTEEPGELQSTGSQRVGHDWATSLSLSFFPTWSLFQSLCLPSPSPSPALSLSPTAPRLPPLFLMHTLSYVSNIVHVMCYICVYYLIVNLLYLSFVSFWIEYLSVVFHQSSGTP